MSGARERPTGVRDAFDLTGRAALVTGAGSVTEGIGNGRAAAVLLAEAGARVGLLDLDAEAAQETLRLVEERGGEGIVVPADVADPVATRSAVEKVAAAYGSVDILVNNVGIVGPAGPATEIDPEAWDAAMRVNVTSMVTMARYCVPLMRQRGGGAIVNVSSTAGLGGGYPSLLYPTSKGAIISLTRSMAAHHGPEGIRVNAVAPGQVFTPRIAARGASQEMRDARRRVAPLRTEGDGWDVGYAILYLASPAARWVTGVVLPVDAGLTAAFPLQSPPSE
ncbi:MAG: SDR family oxidoreductase [Streptosporangiales bacterium]|nr:SDR family oxidoreductase [Streptosporangiales bacterium]